MTPQSHTIKTIGLSQQAQKFTDFPWQFSTIVCKLKLHKPFGLRGMAELPQHGLAAMP
jgi:hypothetical protein